MVVGTKWSKIKCDLTFQPLLYYICILYFMAFYLCHFKPLPINLDTLVDKL